MTTTSLSIVSTVSTWPVDVLLLFLLRWSLEIPWSLALTGVPESELTDPCWLAYEVLAIKLAIAMVMKRNVRIVYILENNKNNL
ncbi:hypothetical protein BDF21DRAFT_412787, partial [Thamnidium elegans]